MVKSKRKCEQRDHSATVEKSVDNFIKTSRLANHLDTKPKLYHWVALATTQIKDTYIKATTCSFLEQHRILRVEHHLVDEDKDPTSWWSLHACGVAQLIGQDTFTIGDLYKATNPPTDPQKSHIFFTIIFDEH